MAKFNISTAQPGQVSEVDKSIIETPVEQKQEATPQAQGSAFEALVNQQPTNVDAAAKEITDQAEVDPDIAAQQEAERVAPLSERFAQAETASPKWQTKEISDGPSGVENIRARSKNMVNLVKDKELSGGWGIGSSRKTAEGGSISEIFKTQGAEAGQQALAIDHANSPAYILQKAGAATVAPGTAQTTVDPNFIATLSAVTENFMMGAQVASDAGAPKETVDEFTGEPTGQLERPAEHYEVSKAQGNNRLGTEINREWQRLKNQSEGKPTDQYDDLKPSEAAVLGDLAKELFYEANPELITRAEKDDEQVYFTVNAKGISELSKSNEARKRLFPTQNVRPSKTKLPKGQFVGEGQKLSGRFTKKAGKLGDISLIEEAMENLHEVPNVVDPRRARVLVSTALPAMLQAIQGKYDGAWANTNGIGTKAINKFEAAKKLDEKRKARERDAAAKRGEEYYEKAPYNVRANMDSLVDTLAQSIRAVALDRKGANYLTYAMQSFTGRVHPQQTYFDPTASKTVRFATRNATPSIAKPGNRVEANLKQMYSMMMIKEASEALPQERVRLLEVHGPKMYEMGKTIETALNEQVPPQLAEAIAQAIENNVPLTDPKFPQVPELQLPDNIRSYIEQKGDDALSVLEGLVDYKNFVDNMKAGRPHHSFFNAYMDGKTNGIANNGMQLGNETAAFRTGVMRTQDKRLLDGDVDIRDQLGSAIKEKVSEGIEGVDALESPGPVYDIINDVADIRDLQKATTMQFGYGKELESFKADIEEALANYQIEKPEEYLRAVESFDGNETKLRDTVWANYMDGLVNALSEDAADARAVMRANATMFALTDGLFSITGPSGFNINMGANQTLSEAVQVRYDVSSKAGRRKPTALLYETKATSAAERGGTPGLYAYGRSLPSPVQSIDAATVAKTVAGKSWEKLKAASNGNPYIHTIYDAFKVDANGYSTVLKEVNKNWLDTTMDWSYLEETQKASDANMKKFWKEFDALPNELNVNEHHGAKMMQYLMSAAGGKDVLSLHNRILKSLYDANATPDSAGKHAKSLTEFAMKTLIKMGYKPGSNVITKEQYGWFVKFMEQRVYNLHSKNSSLVNKTNKQKADLRKKITASGQKVYQYYSH